MNTLLDAKADIKPETLAKIKEAGIVIPEEEVKPDESQADSAGAETATAE